MEGAAYIAMTGMQAASRQMDTIANNLSNAQTTGYKAQRVAFRALPFFYQGLPNRVDVMAQGNGDNMAEGAVVQTGINTNVAINGPGFFVVQSPGGQEAYTRAGDFLVSSNGMLVNANGQAVMGIEGAPIYVPQNSRVSIGTDGTVSALPNTPNAQAISVGQLLVVNPATGSYQEAAGNLFVPTVGSTVDTTPATTSLVPDALENSNVNTVESMVNMISASRLFQWETQAEQNVATNAKAAESIPSNI